MTTAEYPKDDKSWGGEERRRATIETTQFRIKIELALESNARHVAKLADSFDDFKKLYFHKLDDHSARLIKLEENVALLLKVAWITFASTWVVIIGAILKLIIM